MGQRKAPHFISKTVARGRVRRASNAKSDFEKSHGFAPADVDDREDPSQCSHGWLTPSVHLASEVEGVEHISWS